MAESEPVYKFGSPQEHLPTCDKHTELIDMVCEDCDEFVCTDCVKTDHKDHNWVTLVKAASHRRRQLLGFIKTIKDGKLSDIDRKIENTSTKMKEIEKQSDFEMEKLRKHFDDIIARLTEIKTHHEKTLRDNLIERCEQVNRLKAQYGEQKRNFVESVKFMEENNSMMSDYNFIGNHRELLKLVSGEDDDTTIGEYSLRYTSRDLRGDELDSLMGQTFDLEDISVTEANSFQYSDAAVHNLEALNENECYAKFFKSEYFEHINKQSDKKQKYDVSVEDFSVADTGDVYFTDNRNKAIGRLSPSGSISTVVSTRPLVPGGICQSMDGGLLVTLGDTESNSYMIDSRSRRLVRHMMLTGDVIREYEYREDGQTRLFTEPGKVKQNGNSDICVVNRVSDTTGNVVTLSSSGRLRFVYHGQNLDKDFIPSDVVCDFRCNILVADYYNHRIHLLSPDGEFMKFLMSESNIYGPTALSLYRSILWVGEFNGRVNVIQL
ncbi:uncharacterized protein LOC125647119 [Ostrea edulis]|uniref:uncharacterized protein LOC125647119 n=1 Tax=Ostrea edulis TaxID=37623 RepID=UPI0024AE9CCA|nr:uncharacterized protein LOC125647119 [Ostrea edulis]